MSDTIFALSSAPGRAGVAVIRVSGPSAGACTRALTGGAVPPPRMAALRQLRDDAGQPIDQALVLWFAGPASFSGEDVVEFHVHGGRAIVARLLAALAKMAGCRPAEPGEFTRRAVENGKFDLTQAEALKDLIDAETESQRIQALRQYGGALAALYEVWRTRLIRASAWAEAEIDFADEEVPLDLQGRSRAEISDIIQEIQRHLDDSHRGELVREGIYLTLIGPPNAGKSSLLNALAKRDVAIVAETPGTTRDVLEVKLDLGGYAVVVADTAGLRDVADAVENEGVRRALARAESSDVVLLLLDGSSSDPLSGLPSGIAARASLIVWNKSDLPWPGQRQGLQLSLKTGEGFEQLLSAVEAKVAERLDLPREAPVLTRTRHRYALEQAVVSLKRALATGEAELFAEDLRLAARWIGRITGRIDIEELLDVIFRDFCIGK
jgi:tRNA modification GTPase